MTSFNVDSSTFIELTETREVKPEKWYRLHIVIRMHTHFNVVGCY